MSPFRWARFGPGYECSSKGDLRFSAFFAKMPDGRSLEMWYQCDTGHGKGYDPGGRNWRLGKGKPPLDTSVDLWKEYLNLWREWAKRNPELMEELREYALMNSNTLTDRFATTSVNQAHALSIILNELYSDQKQNV